MHACDVHANPRALQKVGMSHATSLVTSLGACRHSLTALRRKTTAETLREFRARARQMRRDAADELRSGSRRVRRAIKVEEEGRETREAYLRYIRRRQAGSGKEGGREKRLRVGAEPETRGGERGRVGGVGRVGGSDGRVRVGSRGRNDRARKESGGLEGIEKSLEKAEAQQDALQALDRFADAVVQKASAVAGERGAKATHAHAHARTAEPTKGVVEGARERLMKRQQLKRLRDMRKELEARVESLMDRKGARRS
jgi:hypothetical protein